MERRFAQEYHWTPKQVDELPAVFVDEQIAVWKAEADVARKKQRRARSTHSGK